MEKFKMSLANVPGKLSRAEMKNVMAGTSNVDSIDGDDAKCKKRDEKCSATEKCCSGLECMSECPTSGSTCG